MKDNMTGISTNIQTRFVDFDPLGHLNNAMYMTYIEVARSNSFYEVLGLDRMKHSAVIAETSIKYLRPVPVGASVDVIMNFTAIGGKSMGLCFTFVSVEDKNHVYASADITQIMIDVTTGKTISIPDDLRLRFEQVMHSTSLIFVDRRKSEFQGPGRILRPQPA